MASRINIPRMITSVFSARAKQFDTAMMFM